MLPATAAHASDQPPSAPTMMPVALAQPHADLELVQLIGVADEHNTLANNFAYGLDVLGDIVLPPGAEAQVDRAQMRALGVLYLAADLEPARIITSVETLAALGSHGSGGAT